MPGEFETPPQPNEQPIPGAGTAPPPAAPSAPASAPPVAPPVGGATPPPSPGAAGAPAQVPQQVPATNPPAPGAPGVPPPQQFATAREYAAHLGLRDAPTRFQNDQDFLRHAVTEVQRAQELQQIAPYASEYMRHHRAFSEWQAQQAAAKQQQQAPAAAAQKWWNPPEFNQAWEQAVVKDQSGNLSVRPGADPTILPRYLAYHQYRQDFANKFLSDPDAALTPMIETRATEIARETVKKELGAFQQQQQAEHFIAQNSNWLFQVDANNRIAVDGTGQRLLSPAGNRFAQHYQAAGNLGMNEPAARQYAMALTQNEIWGAERQTQTATQQQQAADTARLAAEAANAPNRSGALFDAGTPPGTPPVVPPVPPGMSLRDQLATNIARAGLTDRDFE